MGHVCITRGSDEAAPKLVANGSVETSGDLFLLA